MSTETEALSYDHIVEVALEHGFKLKPQVDGRMALNDYVIDFARAVYDIGHVAAKAETTAVGARGISLARELRDQADFDEAESVFGGGSRTRELMREAADALHAGAEERGE